ncbi:MAG: DUF4363 family protein [Provencibacterium sp.]|jgi:hypothetical protein|nr:DUF4363 family protein [Provencibacterium sp.]
MNRFVAALVIMGLILGVCAYSYRLFSSTRDEMISLLDAIESSALAGEEEETVAQLCQEYSERWMEKESRLLRFIRHPQLDEISSLTAELRYLASGENYSHLLAAISRIKVNLEKVGDAEMFGG